MMEISTQFSHFNPDVQYPNYLNSDPQYASQERDVTNWLKDRHIDCQQQQHRMNNNINNQRVLAGKYLPDFLD